MSADRFPEHLLARLTRPTSVEDLRDVLPNLRPFLLDPELAEPASEYLEQAFRDLRRLTADDPDLASEVLVDDMLPFCFAHDERGKSLAHELCRSLILWLAGLPEPPRWRTRATILSRAIEEMRGTAVDDAISLIWVVGYWDQAVKDSLTNVAFSRDDGVGDQALAALASLHIIQADVALAEAAISRLHKRIPVGYSKHREVACGLLGTSETADLIWAHWFASDAESAAKRAAADWFAWPVLVRIAARSKTEDLNVRTWGWMVDLSRRQPEERWDPFLMNSFAVDQLDAPDAIPELVRLMRRSDEERAFAYYDRILACKRPVVVGGWESVPPADLEGVRREAVTPTKRPGQWSTIELHRKKLAWEIILCRGMDDLVPSIDEAVAGEDGYVTQRFLSLAACIGLRSLPTSIPGLIVGAMREGWDEEQRRIAQSGAIDAALGVADFEAFKALLGYCRCGEHGGLLSVVEALAETAWCLAEAGEGRAIERLLSEAEWEAPSDTRKAAGAAIGFLLQSDALNPSQIRRAAALLREPDVEPFTVNKLLRGFMSFPPESIPESVVEHAREILASDKQTSSWDSELREAALLVLIQQPGEVQAPRGLACLLGLNLDGDGMVGPADVERVPHHVLGNCFQADPDRFAVAVASTIRGTGGLGLSMILPWLRRPGKHLPKAVVDALVDRLREAETAWVYDPQLIRILAREAPDRLLTEACADTSRWMSQARADLADVLGDLEGLTGDQFETRLDLLFQLSVDGLYAVRRASHRAASRCEPDRFLHLARSWAGWKKSDMDSPRLYAAECVGWFPHGDLDEALQELEHDPDPEVRAAFRRSIDGGLDRAMAAEFEARVLGVEEPGEIVANWRYGSALALVGDDSTLKRLERRARQAPHPSIRFWLMRVMKALESRWSDVTRRWPEPWYTRQGRLERFKGVLLAGDREEAASGILWLIVSEEQTEKYSWGGWGKTSGVIPDFIGRSVQLIIPGRESLNIIVEQMHYEFRDDSCRFAFHGYDRYPG